MDPNNSETTIDQTEQQLNAALAEYVLAVEAGHPVDLNDFLDRYPPELASRLRPLIEAGGRFERYAPLIPNELGRPLVDGYEILDLLGEGGMGVVYKARQIGTDQFVALKMLRPDREVSGQAIEKFCQEVRAAAKLRHPNRVRIFHFGKVNGQPYYAMELIEGCSLAEKMKQEPGVSKEAALRYLASIAEAVAEAHEKGILHRDLKPHNILIDATSDEALLTDFGLAILEYEDRNEPGEVSGTFPYMAPEATLETGKVSPQTDVYGLGATLYHVLTRHHPVSGKTRIELIERIRKAPPKPLKQLRPDVSHEIEQICLKCLRKDPEDRYASATDFAQALRNYLQRVDYARNFTLGSNLYMWLAPVVLVLNIFSYYLIQIRAWEPWIWLTMYSMYVPVFALFFFLPASTSMQNHRQTVREMYCIWGGKMIAAVTLSITFRLLFLDDPIRSILLSFPVFSALSAVATFATAAKMPRWCLYLPLNQCIGTLMMSIYLPWAPILYGIWGSFGVFIYGYLLRRLGKELS